MLNSLAVDQQEQFYKEHGAYVQTPDGTILFQDGAQDENSITGLGRLIEPPEDNWERKKLIARYWQIVAEAATQDFESFKLYLNGTGKREPAWCTLYTDEDRIEYLKGLQATAKRIRAKYMKAKREAVEATPYWYEQQVQADVEEQKRKQEFLSAVDGIQL